MSAGEEIIRKKKIRNKNLSYAMLANDNIRNQIQRKFIAELLARHHMCVLYLKILLQMKYSMLHSSYIAIAAS